MGKGTINWDGIEAWERLVASIIASGVKLDLKGIATYYGTTYDTLENRLRKIKKDAAVIKQEVDSGQRGEIVPARAKSAPTTPKKPNTPKKANGALNTVANGRVSKTSPSKKRNVKHEKLESTASAVFGELSEDTSTSFGRNGVGFDMEDFNHEFGDDESMLGTGAAEWEG